MAIKLIFKEELIPANADKLIFVLAPIITVIPALVVTAVIPWGGTIDLFGTRFPWTWRTSMWVCCISCR